MGRHHREDDYTHPGNLLKALADGEIDIFDALEHAPLAVDNLTVLSGMRRYARVKEKRKKLENSIDSLPRESI